ncbi:MAG: hypothetical protein LAT64_02770 [Phycisphaerales bacterium]|nr:hypothetical protein [Planctomycetota bacterium]MCH8507680.1 hypothetical protein [Phycisphaerales bacterium]
MLVKVVDHKGKERFINAAFVKSLHPKGDDQADIEISGWATKIRVAQPMDQVAEIINAAMPGSLENLLTAENEQTQSDDNAALFAVIG